MERVWKEVWLSKTTESQKCLRKLLNNHMDVVILWLRFWPTMHCGKRLLFFAFRTYGDTSCLSLLTTDAVSTRQDLTPLLRRISVCVSVCVCVCECVRLWAFVCVLGQGCSRWEEGEGHVYVWEKESGVFLSMKSLGCSGPMIEKCTHGTPLTLGNHKTLSCGRKYSPCLLPSNTSFRQGDVKEFG